MRNGVALAGLPTDKIADIFAIISKFDSVLFSLENMTNFIRVSTKHPKHRSIRRNNQVEDNISLEEGIANQNEEQLAEAPKKPFYKYCIPSRTLLIVAIYFFVGIFGYMHIFENWSAIDALYFSVCTFTTVGFGDITPTSDASRAFTMIYAVLGVVLISTLVGEVMVDFAEASQQKFSKIANKLGEIAGREDKSEGDTSSGIPLDNYTLKAFFKQNWIYIPLILLMLVFTYVSSRLRHDHKGLIELSYFWM